MSTEAIKVTVKLFAAYQEAYRQETIDLEFNEPKQVKEVLEYILEEKPELQQWRELTRFGINLEFVAGETLIKNGDEIVFIPPVSGG